MASRAGPGRATLVAIPECAPAPLLHIFWTEKQDPKQGPRRLRLRLTSGHWALGLSWPGTATPYTQLPVALMKLTAPAGWGHFGGETFHGFHGHGQLGQPVCRFNGF